MTTQSFDNVWEAIEDTPEAAMNMTIRTQLMTEIRDIIEERGLSQAQAAKVLGVTQPRVSDLMRGKIDRFSIDTLVNMLVASGLRVELRTVQPH